MSRKDILEDLGITVKPHLEQFARVNRWKERLDKIRFSNSPESNLDYHYDFIYAFFTNCYHLRDFLRHSKVIQTNLVDDFFANNKEMQICRDICNESKHCILDTPSIGAKIPDTNKKSAKGWAGVFLIREYDYFQNTLKNDNPIKNIKYVVLADLEKYNVFELADKCCQLWSSFFEANNLL
ncbi:hypothetical protein J4401_06100 [Candidatus Woesearchaeota archaeon]|nr:hypothetical protein [Candidatus Woesearchaeota archaeon]